jgi:phosphatidylglycerophosphate synthase
VALALIYVPDGASIVDHSDGEIARLTFQESDLGARLDWAVDTIIHGGIVWAMAVTAGGAAPHALGAVAGIGVVPSAWFARVRPREATPRSPAGSALTHLAHRDLFYPLIAGFALSRWPCPALLGPLALLVAVGSQAYWLGCATSSRTATRVGAA